MKRKLEARRRAHFEEQLTKQGITAERIEEAAAHDLWRYWLEFFAAPAERATGEWVPGGYHWHTFSYEYTYALSGDQASAAYAASWDGLGPYKEGLKLLLLPNNDESLVYRGLAPRPPDFTSTECIVCPLDYAWTMAFTHEDGWLGPYFTRREWVAHPPTQAPAEHSVKSGSPRKRRRR